MALRVLRLFRAHRWSMAALLALVLLRSVVGVVSPFLLRALLDRAIPERSLALVSVLAGGMIAASVVAAALGVLTSRMATVIGQRVMHELRVSVYAHLQSLPLSFFTATRNGEVLSRVVNDVGGVDNVLTNTATGAVQSVTQVIAIAVALFVMDWRFAVAGLVVVPLFLVATGRLGGQRRDIARSRQRSLAALTTVVEESLSVPGVVLAKTMGLSSTMRERFAAQSAEISGLQTRAALAGRWRLASRGAALTIVPAVAYWIVGAELAGGAAPTTLGTVVAFTSMLNRLVSPASSLQGIGQSVSTSMALFGRIFEVLDIPSARRSGSHGCSDISDLSVIAGAVTVESVCFRYPGASVDALDDVSFVAAPGTMTAIVGATGSGKTSLAYLLTRLYSPFSGAISVDGQDIASVSDDSLAAAVGYVAQETYLLHASIAANLRLVAPDATDAEVEAAARAAHIHDLIASLPDGYDTVVGERGYRFSGGERQRLAIARVVLRNPPILVLDEATSALDTATERAVQAALEELSAGRTTIVIAHRLSTVTRADQILVLDRGRIVERGTHEELRSAGGRYAALATA